MQHALLRLIPLWISITTCQASSLDIDDIFAMSLEELSNLKVSIANKVALSYSRAAWQAHLGAFYHSGIDALTDNSAQLQFNGQIRYQLDPDWQLYLKGRNLTDQTIYAAASGAGLGQNDDGETVYDLPRRGRSLMAGIVFTFN